MLQVAAAGICLLSIVEALASLVTELHVASALLNVLRHLY